MPKVKALPGFALRRIPAATAATVILSIGNGVRKLFVSAPRPDAPPEPAKITGVVWKDKGDGILGAGGGLAPIIAPALGVVGADSNGNVVSWSYWDAPGCNSPPPARPAVPFDFQVLSTIGTCPWAGGTGSFGWFVTFADLVVPRPFEPYSGPV